MDNIGNRNDSFRNSLKVTPEDRARRREEENLKTTRELEHYAEYRYTNKLPVHRTRMIKGAKTWAGGHKKAIAISLATLIAAAGIGLGVHNVHRNQELKRDIEQEVYDKSMNLENARVEWDGEKFVAILENERPEMYNLLQSTDLDEIMNRYNSAKNDTEKGMALAELNGRSPELAELTFKMIKASFADSMGEKIDNVRMTLGNVNGVSDLKVSVGIKTAENYSYRDNINKQIPHKYAEIIERAIKNQILVNDNNVPDLQKVIENYNDLKLIINDKQLTIKDDGKQNIVVAEDIEKAHEDKQQQYEEERG